MYNPIPPVGYERRFFVHDEDDMFLEGEEYETQNEAENAAKEEAMDHSEDYVFVVTEVLIRQLKKTNTVVVRTVELENV